MIPSPIDTSMTIKTDRGALLTALGLLRAYAPDEPGVGEFLASVEELAAPVWANACGTALSPSVEPASRLDGSATSIAFAGEE